MRKVKRKIFDAFDHLAQGFLQSDTKHARSAHKTINSLNYCDNPAYFDKTPVSFFVSKFLKFFLVAFFHLPKNIISTTIQNGT